jgi:regulator of PEP synthase PpsR (kinase-PPPase family)
MKKRHVFCISDGTGITAQTLCHSLLSQFEDIEFVQTVLPYVDNEDKANSAVEQVRLAEQQDQAPPIVFTTIIEPELSKIIKTAPGLRLDFLDQFIGPLEKNLNTKSSHTIGRSHSMGDYENYKRRIDALNFSLNTDDGACIHQYAHSDVILIGVSRCGKTPTSLYLALQYGIFVSNYPLTDEDLTRFTLPKALVPHKKKLFGLTIDLNRLIAIRTERRPNSRYASKQQCIEELKSAEKLMRRDGIPCLNSTHLSVEELATKIKQHLP